MYKKQILFVVLVIAIILVGLYYFTQQNSKSRFDYSKQTVQGNTKNVAVQNSAASQDCASPVKFTSHFTDIDTIKSIIPPVFRNSRGTMPTTLINIEGKAPLYMPATGRLIRGSYHTEQGAEFYMWEIDAGCGVTVVFDHVTEPVERIRRLFPNTPRNDSLTEFFDTPLAMESGELLGYTTGSVDAHNWNFAVYSASEKNYLWEKSEFAQYQKYFTQVCPFKYYDRFTAQMYEAFFILSFNDIVVESNLCVD